MKDCCIIIFTEAGDFNTANMKTAFTHFHQFATRGENLLDLFYSNINEPFKAAPCPHFSSSDHLSVMIIPAYKPLLIRKKPIVKQVKLLKTSGSMLSMCLGTLRNAWRLLVWSERSPHKPMRHPGRSGRARLNARNDAFKFSDTVALKTAKANLN